MPGSKGEGGGHALHEDDGRAPSCAVDDRHRNPAEDLPFKLCLWGEFSRGDSTVLVSTREEVVWLMRTRRLDARAETPRCTSRDAKGGYLMGVGNT